MPARPDRDAARSGSALPVSRREVLRAAAGAAVLAPLPGLLAQGAEAAEPWSPRPPEWSNWSGSQQARPAAWLYPADETELIRQLAAARTPLRVAGASHSFSPLVNTDGSLLSLDRLSGLVSHDAARHQATVWAGTRLRDLGEPLWQIGQALVNQGDVDPQSVAGAIGTSTHGTGITLGSFSSLVRGLRLVTAAGEAIECSPQREPDVFHAACTSVGALGVVTQVTLQNRAAYHLREHSYAMPLSGVLDQLETLRDGNRHFEFWAFYKADLASVKILNETSDAPTPVPRFSLPVDAVLTAFCELARAFPGSDAALQKLLMRLHPDEQRVGRSFEVFPSPRNTRFNEMEYELPARHGPACLDEILQTVRRHDFGIIFPLEYRYVAGDDAWLSPFYGRDSASISIHQYYRQDYRELFRVVEPIFWKYEGRPHWGKLHTLGAKQLAGLYPRWDEFQAQRRRLDPRGRFLNPHLATLFGVSGGVV